MDIPGFWISSPFLKNVYPWALGPGYPCGGKLPTGGPVVGVDIKLKFENF